MDEYKSKFETSSLYYKQIYTQQANNSGRNDVLKLIISSVQ